MVRALALLLLVLLTTLVSADGKMFGVTGDLKQPGIKHQRAVLSWHEGQQTIIVENVVESQAEAAWLLPVPGKPTQVEALPEGYFTYLNSRYQMRVINTPDFIFGAIFIFLFALAVALTMYNPKGLQFTLTTAAVILVTFILAAIFYPVFGGDGQRTAEPQFAFAPVGDYSVTVIPPKDARAGIAWLRKGGFAVSPQEAEILENYAQKGWHFIAARLHPTADLTRPHPLLIRCPSSQPVYPMQLTGLQGGPLNLELYVVGKSASRIAGMVAQRTFTIPTVEEEQAIVFPSRHQVTRHAGRFSLSSNTADIHPTFDGDPAHETVYWTASGKFWSVVERTCIAATLSLIFVAPWFLKKRGRSASFGIAMGVAILAGLIWSIPIFAGPTAGSGGKGVYRLRIMAEASEARRIAQKVSSSSNESEARALSVPNQPKSRVNSYLLEEYSDSGMKLTTIQSTGEPAFIMRKWPLSKP